MNPALDLLLPLALSCIMFSLGLTLVGGDFKRFPGVVYALLMNAGAFALVILMHSKDYRLGGKRVPLDQR